MEIEIRIDSGSYPPLTKIGRGGVWFGLHPENKTADI